MKLITPALSFPIKRSKGSTEPPTVNIDEGIVAKWEVAENQEFDVENLGKDGMISWLCSLAPKAKVTLTLKWEVSSPEGRATIVGL